MIALEAFKINTVDGVPILTLLVESLNARNAHWVKEEVLHYIRDKRPKGLIINLNNVVHLGHIGLGTLIAINNLIRTLRPHAFICLQPEAQKLIHASHLEQVFHVWTPAQDCLICHQAQCLHKTELQTKSVEFLARNYPVDESKIPHLNEMVEHIDVPRLAASKAASAAAAQRAKVLAQLRPADEPEISSPRRNRLMNVLGMAAVGTVFLGLIVAATWYTATKYANSGYTRVVPMNTEVTLDAYDMNGDGHLSKDDLPKMTETQRSNLSFTKYCRQLGLACKSPN